MVGDVVGRGPRAAAVMGQLRSALRAFASDDRDGPAEVMTNLSRFAGTVEGADVATACYAELDPATSRLRYVCAGHPPPLLVGADGATSYLHGGRGVPLGVVHEAGAYHEAEARVPAGATLVLYTDGLVERRGMNIDVGFARLARALAHHRVREPTAMTEAVLAELGGSGDDCALLACRADPPSPDLDLVIPSRPDAIRRGRRGMRAWLAGLGVAPEQAEDLVLAAGEALANSIEHGHGSRSGGTVRLTAALDTTAGELRVEVRDDGSWRMPAAEPGDRGRGLAIMRALMDGVDVTHDDAGTRVAMTRRLDGLLGHAAPAEPAGDAVPERAGAADVTPDGVLRLSGDIDASNAAALLAPLDAGPGEPVAIDLTGVAAFGSAAIQAVAAAARRRSERGGTLAVIAAPGSLARRLLEITGLEAVVAIRDPEEDGGGSR